MINITRIAAMCPAADLGGSWTFPDLKPVN
jgi:hypothetical protein